MRRRLCAFPFKHYVIVIVGVVNVAFTMLHIVSSILALHKENNNPLEIPMVFDAVAMTLLRNTTHFQMNLSDPVSRIEWITLSDHPFVVHIGKTRRTFQVSFFHELHCIHVMEQAFLRGEYRGLNSHHVRHCLNYLRQSFLCSSDDDLEGGDFESEQEDWNGGTKVCRDWEGVDLFVRNDLADWHRDNPT